VGLASSAHSHLYHLHCWPTVNSTPVMFAVTLTFTGRLTKLSAPRLFPPQESYRQR
jgi:hypothetical protein